MYLVRTIKSMAMLMIDDEFEFLHIGIVDTYPFLNKSQKNDLFEGYKTQVSIEQVEKIKARYFIR